MTEQVINVTNTDLLKGYIQEALAAKREENAAKIKFKDVIDAVKESEDKLGITVKLFKQAIQTELTYAKVQEKIDILQDSIDLVDSLGGR